MRKIIAISVLAIMMLTALPVMGATNLITNGSFEEPVVVASQLWDIFQSGTPNLGWTVEWRSDIPAEWQGYQRPDPALQELQRGVNGWLPQEGAQYTELDADWFGPSSPISGEPASILIYQDIPTTARCKYELKFYFSPRPETGAEDNVLEVKWNGNVIDTISRAGGSQTDWSEHTYTLTASGPTTRLQFTDLGTANSLGTFLDNVSLVQTSCECRRRYDCGDIKVENENSAKVYNDVTAVASTGDNEIKSRTGGRIITGNAVATTSVVNTINTNITRIRR
jgi:hypothetical protein